MSEYKYWFQKNNYMGEFLSEKSLNIIKSIQDAYKTKQR
jgi:hypothetical protein